MHCARSIRPLDTTQRGGIMILALVFMAALLILGTSAVSSVIFGERMAGHMRDQQMAFQAAEAALAEAERQLAQTPALTDVDGFYPNGSVRMPDGDPGTRAYWTGAFEWKTNAASQMTVDLGVRTNAYYVVEALPPPISQGSGGPTEAYRITVRATGATNEAVTLLQTTYIR